MSAYATEKLIKFSNKLLKQVYEMSVFDKIVNRDYEGEVKDQASTLKIGSLAKLSWKNYSGSVSYDSVNEIIATFVTDQAKYNAFKLRKYDQFLSFIKDPKGTLMDQLVSEFKEMVDAFVLGFHADVASGNWYGTNYTTGTVTVTTVTGAVVGVGTTFTSAMVNKPFKATGHSAWYRVATYTDATHITIEDDKDDVASAYTGGTITAAAYTIQANTAKAIDNSATHFLDMVSELKTLLDEAKIPQNDRWLVIPPRGEQALLRDGNIKLNVPEAFQSMVKAGYLSEVLGFNVIRSNQVAGDNTNGWSVLAVQTSFLTFADGMTEGPEELRLEGDFGTGYRELRVYGAKVADERRKFAAKALVTF
jgi:hypothetical protein